MAQVVRNLLVNAGDIRDGTGVGGAVLSLNQEDPVEEGMAATAMLLPGESYGQRHLVGYSPWGSKGSDTLYHFTAEDKTWKSSANCSGLQS